MKTTASPAETLAIVIVAVICLAFWLIMVVGIAPRMDARKRERRLDTEATGAEATGTHAPGAAEARDDLPRAQVPLPPQRQSATDEAAPSRRPGR